MQACIKTGTWCVMEEGSISSMTRCQRGTRTLPSKYCVISSWMRGIRVEPPTRTTSWMLALVNLESASTLQHIPL